MCVTCLAIRSENSELRVLRSFAAKSCAPSCGCSVSDLDDGRRTVVITIIVVSDSLARAALTAAAFFFEPPYRHDICSMPGLKLQCPNKGTFLDHARGPSETQSLRLSQNLFSMARLREGFSALQLDTGGANDSRLCS